MRLMRGFQENHSGMCCLSFFKCCLLAWGTNTREQETSGASHCIARTGYGAGESWNGRTADIPGSWAHHWKYTRGQVRRGSTDRGGKEWTPEKDAYGMIHELCKFSNMSSVIYRVFPCWRIWIVRSCPSQGVKRVLSGLPGQLDFLGGQIAFKAYLPKGRRSRQTKSLAKTSNWWPQASKLGQLLGQRTSWNSIFVFKLCFYSIPIEIWYGFHYGILGYCVELFGDTAKTYTLYLLKSTSFG